MPDRIWTLIGADGRPFASNRPGTLGGHRRNKLYGRLDCRSALQALARGGYKAQRVFFLDEATALSAGYRPCAVCMPERYRMWKAGELGAQDDA
ncbi:Ada metal-binding domain-containing protein [Pseudomonas solani]|uniref:Ada metal-binding domain-containing protein n=1 Tax=Pseudomonas solani TaxID=2731552 RepID=UPI003F4AA3B8